MHQQGKIVMQALENAYLHFTNFSWIFVFPSPLSLLPTEYPVLVFQSVNQVYMFNIISIILCDIQY